MSKASEFDVHLHGPEKKTARNRLIVSSLFFGVLLLFFFSARSTNDVTETANMCPQVQIPLYPERNNVLWSNLVDDLYESISFKAKAVAWLSDAVKVKTESIDQMGPVGNDPRWEAFGDFHHYLENTFPLTHSLLSTKVNTYGLVYRWEGSDHSLAPILLAGHQDVVPVDLKVYSDWKYPPYKGHYDGKTIWGRGVSDDKPGLIGIMATIETLLEKEFIPTRTIMIAFGFDEETSGLHGAREIGKYLLSTYGRNCFAMIVDEGGSLSKTYGTIFAQVGTAEKGKLDTRVLLASPGGHSSVPPTHTSIGMLAALLVEYENHPYPVRLARDTTPYSMLQCFGAHATDMQESLRTDLQKSAYSDAALARVEKVFFENIVFRSLVGTTQAIDLIGGGVKTNALPEQAWAVVNHRIAGDSSVNATKKYDTARLIGLAEKFNLDFISFGEKVITSKNTSGILELSDAWGTAIEPAPITPTSLGSLPYAVLSGSIKATFALDHEDEVFVTPSMPNGNTGEYQGYYHIFRYNHKNGATNSHAHTVNENILADDFLEMIKFLTTLVLNVDERVL